jgi:signal transduction histidine kinase
MHTRRSVSLRTKLLAIVFFGALLPLATLGLWLVRNTQRSAEESLRARLDTTLSRAANQVGTVWTSDRSALYDLAQDSIVRGLLVSADRRSTAITLEATAREFAALRSTTQLILIRDSAKAPRWVVAANEKGAPTLLPAGDSLKVGGGSVGDVFAARIPIRRRFQGDTLGWVDARFRIASLIQGWTGGIAGASAVMTLVDRATGAMASPLPFDAALLQGDRFRWGGDEWLTQSRQIDDPFIEIVAAAPLTSFMEPFDRAAKTGAIALAIVTFAALFLVTLLTRRVTGRLVALADAADAVAAGDLDRRVESATRDEVGRLAIAFNTMVESLRRTLAQLSQRQAVAAVGEFASALAHEVRNPLSAIRLNLQHVEERLDGHTALGEPVRHALRDIARLENTVASALRLARTGTMAMDTLALAAVIDSAVRVARPEALRRGIDLDAADLPRLEVRGNAAALEQLFLNLVLNGIEAAPRGGRVGVEVRAVGSDVDVRVWDTGPGFSAEGRERAFEPFFTTKAEGTGLGLSVAKRIATAHGGHVSIEAAEGRTTVIVRLPVADGGSAGSSAARLTAGAVLAT